MKLENKNVVITGASKGLGKALAFYVAKSGANPILIARDSERLEFIKNEIQQVTGKSSLVFGCDITSEEEVKRAAIAIKNRLNTIDVLINNAGIGHYVKSEELPNQMMRNHFEVNFFGAYYCVKAFLPLLKKSKHAYVLNVGSLFSYVSLAENSIYSASKHALAGFTEGLRMELKPYNIKVGFFAPGAINTPFQKNKGTNAPSMPKALMMESKEAAAMIGKMIKRDQKVLVRPRWLLPILKMKQWAY